MIVKAVPQASSLFFYFMCLCEAGSVHVLCVYVYGCVGVCVEEGVGGCNSPQCAQVFQGAGK